MMRFGMPNFSRFCIASGNAASLDAVEKAISHGSLMYFQNVLIGIFAISAIGKNTQTTSTISDP